MNDGLATERDACGVGFVADARGRRSYTILQHALTAVANLSHRGAVAADGKTGDGAGVMTQLPYAVLRRDLDLRDRERAMALVQEVIAQTGLRLVGWRDVPTDPDALGDHARATQPHIAQVVVAQPGTMAGDAFDRALYLCRRWIERRAGEAGLALYVPSCSRRTVVYKALLTSPWLSRFYRDLTDPIYETALAVFHQRYSTNTFPSWSLAQPFRFLAHNGEINTLGGNVHWMQARDPELRAAIWGDRLRVLGNKNEDGTRYKAEDVVSGSFRTLPAQVVSVDAASNTMQVKDLSSKDKQPLTIHGWIYALRDGLRLGAAVALMGAHSASLSVISRPIR